MTGFIAGSNTIPKAQVTGQHSFPLIRARRGHKVYMRVSGRRGHKGHHGGKVVGKEGRGGKGVTKEFKEVIEEFENPQRM